MSNFLFFVFKSYYTSFLGFIIKLFLLIRGVKIGKNFKADKFPKLILENSNFTIGDNVTFFGEVEIRLLKSASLKISSNCKIDNQVRIIATNNAKIVIDESNVVGLGTIINGGTDIFIGKKCLISGYTYLQSSSHGYKSNKFIRDQEHTYDNIHIGDDVWIGAHSIILMGVKIEDGGIVGANSFVRQRTIIKKNEMFAGNPAVFKSLRD